MTWWMWEGSNKLLRTSESKSNTQLRMRKYEMQSYNGFVPKPRKKEQL
jgi:hypothetical protein